MASVAWARDMLTTLNDSCALIDSILATTMEPSQRAALLAKMLRSLWTSSALHACLLRGESYSELCVLDERGEPSSEWADHLRLEIAKFTPPRPGPGFSADRIPHVLTVRHLTLSLEPIEFHGRWGGMLAVASQKGASEESEAWLRSLLIACSQRLAPCLYAEVQERERATRERELTEQERLANFGEVAGSVAHSFNNFLNNLLLQMAVLELTVPENMSPELAQIRRQGLEAALMIRHLQQYRLSQRSAPQMVDLNAAVRAAVEELSRQDLVTSQGRFVRLSLAPSPRPTDPPDQSAVPVNLSLSAALHPVAGSAVDVKRLCVFLVKNAAAVAGSTGALTIRTEQVGDKASLSVEDTGPTVPDESLLHLFEPRFDGRVGTDSLELAACHSLVRRLEGTIAAEKASEGGLTIHVLLPTRTAGEGRP